MNDETAQEPEHTCGGSTPDERLGCAACEEPATPAKRKRGFAGMTPEKVRAIASAGGKAAHAAGTAHKFTPDEARVAGHAGGVAPHVRRGRGTPTVGS